jgi:hypothetical protein
VKGIIEQTLVFDSKLTTYEMLEKLDIDKIRFITLRRSGKKLIEKATTPVFKSNEIFLKIVSYTLVRQQKTSF